jgi:hypothetical protein
MSLCFGCKAGGRHGRGNRRATAGRVWELRFLALSLPGDTTKEKSSQILEMLSRREDRP